MTTSIKKKTKLDKKWIQRRWLDFRNGHAVYLVFGMTFMNFIAIQYALVVQEIESFREIFSPTTFVALFTAIYVPAAIIIGYWHMRKQMPKEQEQIMENNPYAFKIAPGITEKFNMPGTIIGYELQLKGMRINNQTADALNKLTNSQIEKWSEQEFAEIHNLQSIAIRLQKGDDINNIVK